MSEVENLRTEEGIKKLKAITKEAKICHFVSALTQLPLQSRPMSTADVDDDGNIWFMSKDYSNKNFDIESDNRVQLFYINNSDYEYLSIYGTAEIMRDKDKVEQVWKPIAKTWFNEGKDDPSLTLIKVTPLDAYYWDTKSNKIISLIKIAAGAIAGKPMDDGIQGNIKV